MLELDDNYFKEEERCGFKVLSMMKRVWAVEMDVLTEIDRICKEYGLTSVSYTHLTLPTTSRV